MDNPSAELLIAILRDCQAAGPEPIYPAEYAQAHNLDRATLDGHLDELRLKGLVTLTEWVKGKGQGYAITPEGRAIVKRVPAGSAVQAAIQLNMHRPRKVAAVFDTAPPTSGEVQEDLSTHRRPTTWSRGEAVRDALLNVPTPYVTWSIIAANVIVFMIGASLAERHDVPLTDYLAGEASDVKAQRQLGELYFQMGSLSWIAVLKFDQWWRLLTHCFLHSGVLHLGLNMSFLYVLGPRIESMWSPWRYAVLYVFSGICGGVASVLVHSNALGASGACCGIFASLITWIWLNREHIGPDLTERFLRNIFVMIVVIALISMLPSISASGHLGGGLGGLILAFPMTYNRFGKPPERLLGLLCMIAVVAVTVVAFVIYWQGFES